MTKLIWAVIQEETLDATLAALREKRFGVTQMGSTGGFLRKGNVTLIIGLRNERVDEAMSILCEHCGADAEVQVVEEPAESRPAPPGRGVAFVLDLWNEHVAEMRDEASDPSPA